MRVMRVSFPALLGAAALVALSCGEPTSLGVDTSAPSQGDLSVWPSLIGLLQCAPLSGDSITQVIGPEGGTLHVGPHRLFVPAGALPAPVRITAVTPSDTVNRITFQPDGLIFSRPAALTMSYANCGPLRLLVPKQIAYTTDALDILDYLPSFDAWWTQKVSARVEHFSTYAVAW